MSFRQKHPILTGLIVLAGISFLFLVGISLFVAMLIPGTQGDLFAEKEGIGVVEIKGVMIEPEETLQTLTSFRNNPDIKAVVIRINSPGGAVGTAQEIFEEIKRTKAVKPVIASMGSVAASGGYYVAMGADTIVASPGTITGSMGVIIKFANLEKLFDTVGYRPVVLKSGRLKDIGASNRAMTIEEKELLQEMLDTVHDQFINAIAEQRSLAVEKVRQLADGRIFSGEQALRENLIDTLGNFTDAVGLAAEAAGLDKKDPHLIYPKEKGFSFLKLLGSSIAEEIVGKMPIRFPLVSFEWVTTQ